MQPPSTIGQPALSVLVVLPPSAHMAQNNPSPLAPARRPPPPLINRKSGSTVPVLKSFAGTSPSTSTTGPPQPSSRLRYHTSHLSGPLDRHDAKARGGRVSPDLEQDDEGMDPIRIAARRASLAPGLGAGTEVRSPDLRSIPKLGTIEPSPPGTPRSASPLPGDNTPPMSSITHPNLASLNSYKFGPSSSSSAASGFQAAPVTVNGSPVEAPSFGPRQPAELPGAKRSRRPVTAATATIQPHRGGSMALPSGSGFGIGGGSFSKTRPGWEADEIVTVLRSGGLEGK
jgi:hypothetical protein